MKTLKAILDKRFVYLSILTIIISLSFFVNCGTNAISTVGNPNTTGNSNFDIPEGDTAFYTPTTTTLPVFAQTSSSQSLNSLFATSDFTSGNAAYEIFNVLQEYTYPDDEGKIDLSNIYKLLFEAGNNYSNALTEVTELDTRTTISSPFDMGNTPETYTHASDNYALASDGSTVTALLTWIWDESSIGQMSYGVMEGTFNLDTGDITIDMVYLVDYAGTSNYCLRYYVTGNSKTHEFTFKSAKTGSDSNSYGISMLGTGISRSDDSSDYFVLKVMDKDNLSAYPDGRYFKLAASSDEDDVEALPLTGSAASEISDPNNYIDTLDAMTFFTLDGSDHATEVTDFTNSSIELDY